MSATIFEGRIWGEGLTVAIVVSRFLSHLNPARSVPFTLGLSALLLFGEWRLVEALPRMGAVAVYLHLSALTLVLFSGFWSVVNERFDPYTAKTVVARASGFGALGGVLGGTWRCRWRRAWGSRPCSRASRRST